MVKDDTNVKFADEKKKKSPLEQVQEFSEDLKISRDNTRINEILHIIQKRPWLNLMLHSIGTMLMVLLVFLLYWVLKIWFDQVLSPYILFYPTIIIVALLAGFGQGLLVQ